MAASDLCPSCGERATYEHRLRHEPDTIEGQAQGATDAARSLEGSAEALVNQASIRWEGDRERSTESLIGALALVQRYSTLLRDDLSYLTTFGDEATVARVRAQMVAASQDIDHLRTAVIAVLTTNAPGVLSSEPGIQRLRDDFHEVVAFYRHLQHLLSMR